MAVLKVKAAKSVEWFLPLMERELIAPMLAFRLPVNVNFEGALGDTVTLRTNALRAVARDYEWRTRTAPIVFDDIVESDDGVDVKLDTHLVSGTTLTDEHYTLDEIDFAREVLAPQARAIAERIESKTVAAFNAITFKSTLTAVQSDDPLLVAVEARRLLDSHKVAPRAGRFWLIGSNVEAAWLASDRLAKYEYTGQTGTPALRQATVGSLVGTPVVTSLSLPPDFCLYGHPSMLALANVAPRVPRGVVEGARTRAGAFAARYIVDYDPNYLRDRAVTSSFFGATAINDERQLTGANAGDLLAEGDLNRGVNNVRGVKVNFTGGSVFTSGAAQTPMTG